jgi:hypothetical protein
VKKPIELNQSHLSSFVTALLMERGLTEYTMSFDQYTELDLGSYGLSYTGDWTEGADQPDSITVTIFKVQ